MTGAMLWLEIQEGKDRMSTKEHQQLGSTAACVIRGVQASEKLTRFSTVHDEGQEVIQSFILVIAGLEASRLLQQ